eukprot:5535192-Prymnesium_polylepis.1
MHVACDAAAFHLAQVRTQGVRVSPRVPGEGVDNNVMAKIEEMIKRFKAHRNANGFARVFIRNA